MMQAHCMVCNDKRRFQTTVNDVERIANALKRIIGNEEHNVADHNLWGHIRMDNKHSHLMCGHCSQVNEMELRNAENKVHTCVYTLCEKIRSGDYKQSDVHDALHTLQGHYPMLYRIVDQEYRKKGS